MFLRKEKNNVLKYEFCVAASLVLPFPERTASGDSTLRCRLSATATDSQKLLWSRHGAVLGTHGLPVRLPHPCDAASENLSLVNFPDIRLAHPASVPGWGVTFDTLFPSHCIPGSPFPSRPLSPKHKWTSYVNQVSPAYAKHVSHRLGYV